MNSVWTQNSQSQSPLDLCFQKFDLWIFVPRMMVVNLTEFVIEYCNYCQSAVNEIMITFCLISDNSLKWGWFYTVFRLFFIKYKFYLYLDFWWANSQNLLEDELSFWEQRSKYFIIGNLKPTDSSNTISCLKCLRFVHCGLQLFTSAKFSYLAYSLQIFSRACSLDSVRLFKLLQLFWI